jgi:hypothetical protein
MKKSSYILTILLLLFFVPTSFAATTKTLNSTPELTAYITSMGTYVASAAQIAVGDTQGNTAWRGLLSFDMSGIPSGAIISR